MYNAGNRGPKVKSDCYVEFIPKESGGIDVQLKSKVEVYYGKSIRTLIESMLNYYNIEHAQLIVEDTGALPFILMARLEAVLRKATNSNKEYLPEILTENLNSTDKNRFRFSRLYLPGNSPKMMLNAGLHNPCGLILDLEDAVAFDKKYEARFVVRNALRALNFYGAERMVRINQGEMGLEDLEFLVPHNVNLILVPKCEKKEDLQKVNNKIDSLKTKYNIDYPIWLMPIIESAKGVIHAHEIALQDNVVALAIGLEDYTADLGTRRTNEATESFYARCQLVNAAKAAGVQPIDSVFSDVADMEGLKQNVLKSKSLGFVGMGCIHPRQIKVIKDNFAPDIAEIEKAKKIYLAFVEATKKGLGVVSLGTKMIDPPVVKRAETTINLAIETGKLNSNWAQEYE
ncbi:MAG: aldolase/citrate lyase family protein [Hyphomicrobiales bacterium]